MQDLKYWLALWRAPGVGPVRFAELVKRFGTPAAVFEAGGATLSACALPKPLVDYLTAPDWARVEGDLAWAEQDRNQVVTLADPRYPSLLKEIPDPPPLLFVHGQVEVLSKVQIAMVGSRNPTPGGEDSAFEFARYLASGGVVITSGLATGIDAASHRGALAGNGGTVAVAGTGLDRVYPARHRDLAHAIAESGALVSELPPGTGPTAGNFPRRNRIISGLSVGTLVVEAALKSGSLITARQAAEQGREVFAIPGSIHNPLARGCHALIRQGAKLVETADDILEELLALAAVAEKPARQDNEGGEEQASTALDSDYRGLLEAMGFEPTSVDVLVQRTGLTPESVSSMLLIMELQGHITSVAGGLYCRSGKRTGNERERA